VIVAIRASNRSTSRKYILKTESERLLSTSEQFSCSDSLTSRWGHAPGVSLAYLGKQGAQLPDVMGTNSKLNNLACYAAPPSPLHHSSSVRITTTCGLGSTELERALHNRLVPITSSQVTQITCVAGSVQDITLIL